MTDITAYHHCFHFVHKQVKQKGPDGRGLLLWPTRKDSEPLPRFARVGSTAKQASPRFSLGASTHALGLSNRPKQKGPDGRGLLLWPTWVMPS